MRLKKALALIFAALLLYLAFGAVVDIARTLAFVSDIWWGLSPSIITDPDPLYDLVATVVIRPAMFILQMILPVVIVVWKRQAIYSILRVD